MDLLYWSVLSFSMRGGDRVKRMNGKGGEVSSFQPAASINLFEYIVHTNLVQYPNNNMSITAIISLWCHSILQAWQGQVHVLARELTNVKPLSD